MISLNPINTSKFSTTAKIPQLPSNNNSTAPSVAEKKLWDVSKSFETILINEMFKSMRNSLEGDKLIGENSGTEIFKDFLNTERSEIVSQNSDFGIARAIYEENKKFL